jgi:hypothetical protein
MLLRAGDSRKAPRSGRGHKSDYNKLLRTAHHEYVGTEYVGTATAEETFAMNDKAAVVPVDKDQQLWYRVCGIAALVLGAAYIIIVPLYARVGPPPAGGEAWFKYLPGKTAIWWAILILSIFTDFLLVPVALALYLALREINRNAMLLATAFIGLFVVLDLAVTWSHYASILILYRNYSHAANDIQRAAYLAAANYASAILVSPLEIVYAIVTLSFGILVIGFVMLSGVFNKSRPTWALPPASLRSLRWPATR